MTQILCEPRDRNGAPAPALPPSPGMVLAMSMMEQAERYAEANGRQPCEFAVSTEELCHRKVTSAELRCLVEQGYATACDRDAPNGRPRNRLHYTGETCFMLTPKGAKFLEQGGCLMESLEQTQLIQLGERTAAREGPPHWDAILRAVSVGQIIVKRFRAPASSQELLLAALEAAAWARWIKNPLPRNLGARRGPYLRAAIHRFNCHQMHVCLRFEADGRGVGFYWRRTDESGG